MMQHFQRGAGAALRQLEARILVGRRLAGRHAARVQAPGLRGQIARDYILDPAQGEGRACTLGREHVPV